MADLLSSTGELLHDGGVDAVTPTRLAERAGIPASALYQYFPNCESLIDAYLEQRAAELDGEVTEAVLALDRMSLRSVLEATVLGHLRFYARNLDVAHVWLSSPPDSMPLQRGQERNQKLARRLKDSLVEAGMLRDDVPIWQLELMVRLFTAAIEMALFEPRAAHQREAIVLMTVDMVYTQALQYATSLGRRGIARERFRAAMMSEQGPARAARGS